MSRSGGSFQHLPHLLFLCITFTFTFFHASGVNSFCFIISLKIHHFSCLIIACFDVFCSDFRCCLVICLFFESLGCSSQLFCRDLWDSHHIIGVVVMHTDAALIFVLTEFLFSLFFFFVVDFFVEFSKDIGNFLSRRDDFSFLIPYLGDEHSFLCRFDSWDVLYP